MNLNQLAGPSEKNSEVPLFLHPVLAEQETIFYMPLGLPSIRGHEHLIVLKGGSQPISV